MPKLYPTASQVTTDGQQCSSGTKRGPRHVHCLLCGRGSHCASPKGPRRTLHTDLGFSKQTNVCVLTPHLPNCMPQGQHRLVMQDTSQAGSRFWFGSSWFVGDQFGAMLLWWASITQFLVPCLFGPVADYISGSCHRHSEQSPPCSVECGARIVVQRSRHSLRCIRVGCDAEGGLRITAAYACCWGPEAADTVPV